MKVLSTDRAVDLGYSADKRKRRRQHRRNAHEIAKAGGFFVGVPPARGTTLHGVMSWHLFQARYIGR